MIETILLYFKTKKLMAVLFATLVIVTVYGAFQPESQQAQVKNYGHSEAVTNLENIETQVREKVKDVGSMAVLLKDDPGALFALNAMMFGGLFAIVGGLIVLFCWVSRPGFRERIIVQKPVDSTPWRLAMIFEVVVFFITGAYLISIISSLLIKYEIIHLSDNAYMLFSATFSDVMCLGLVLWSVHKVGGSARELGIRLLDGSALREVKVAFLGYIAILPIFLCVLVLLMILVQLFSYQPPAHPLVTIFLEEGEGPPSWLMGFSIFLAVVIGPILEELFFRGFCYPILRKRFGIVVAMALSAAFFAAVHESGFAFLPIFILGMGLAYLYEIRGSLVAPMILHVTHNLIFITYFFCAKKLLLQLAG